MAALTNAIEKQVLNFLFGRTVMTFPKPADVCLALFKTAPTDAGAGGGEVDEDGLSPSYERVAVIFGDAAGNSPSHVRLENDVSFPLAQESWGTIVAVGVMDSDVKGQGNLLAWGALTNPGTGQPDPKPIGANDMFTFPKDDLEITLD